MSRIGKQPVPLPAGVKVAIKDRRVEVTGPGGSLSFEHPAYISVAQDAEGKFLNVSRASDVAQHRASHGMTRAILNNMVIGVTSGYEKKLELYGTGYNCAVSGETLELNVGFAHPVKLAIPSGLKVKIEVPAARGDETPAKLTVGGIDKQVVGQFARTVKDTRPPEPYKGKGIRFEGEQIRRKAGKAFAGTAG